MQYRIRKVDIRPRVSVLITDIDNILFDWVEIWYKPFGSMLEKLVSSSGVSRQQLIQEIKQVQSRRVHAGKTQTNFESPHLAGYPT